MHKNIKIFLILNDKHVSFQKKVEGKKVEKLTLTYKGVLLRRTGTLHESNYLT